MVFTSWAFAAFFLAVLAALWILRTREQRQGLILIASAYFYAYWQPWYLLLLLTPSTIDYFCALRIEETADRDVRKRWLLVSLVTNLGLLAYFKYTNFFVDNIAALLGVAPRHFDILLPVGISFYTFKTLSYTIDVYRGELSAERNLWKYAMFVTYFPELVAGPIVRASIFLPQMARQLTPSWHRAGLGLQLILLGVTKKLLIADRLSRFIDPVFRSPAAFDGSTTAAAVVAYSIQIYCDFSGYSDIAIGVSRIIGFDLPENFNMPYAATSITEFWHRWHMTLSRWLRDYVYIPLGGNRRGKWQTYRNLFITMLLGGLWHGASWTFVVWGGLHGVGLAVHKLWSERTRRDRPARWYRNAVSWILTYAFVCVGWIFFRSASFADATVMLRKVVGLDPGGIHYVYAPLVLFILPVVILVHVLGVLQERAAVPGYRRMWRLAGPRWLSALHRRSRTPTAVRVHGAAGLFMPLPLRTVTGGFLLGLWLLVLFLFSPLASSPFIYFQF